MVRWRCKLASACLHDRAQITVSSPLLTPPTARRSAPNELVWVIPSPDEGGSRRGLIGIGGHLAAPPSHTTGHTGPYHGGSIELSWGRNIESGETEGIEKGVAQGLLDCRMS